MDALELLQQQSPSLSRSKQIRNFVTQVDPKGVPRYLTSIIASPLHWIEDEHSRERIWCAASARLSERSGRTAMPSMTRTFEVDVSKARTVEIEIHEPSLTSDNLGFKTWTSSVLLSKRLSSLRNHLPHSDLRVLELGAGTGLVGIAAACSWGVNVILTDLPEILSNLQRNIDNNRELIVAFGGDAHALALDWSDDTQQPVTEEERFSVIVAADPLYSPDHPVMLVNTVHRCMRRSSEAIFITELPLRHGYKQEREDLKIRLLDIGLVVAEEGYECGPEDWQGKFGEQTVVECWWSVWRYKGSASDG